jgi:glycine/D-amino acid oxidase-like deaminating enzyme
MKDLCIVGFGLAGLSVARQAERNGYSFDIYSDNSQRSSRIAGGLLNPVSVKRMKPVWQVEKYFDYAKNFYRDLGAHLNIDIIQDIPINVFIHNTEQENNWFEAYDKPRVRPYISDKVYANDPNSALNAKMLGVINASLVNLDKLFTSGINHYRALEALLSESFNHTQLDIFGDHVLYKHKKYKHVVFCEGYGTVHNPYFKDLGIYGNKGDYIIFRSKGLRLNCIAKAKYFLISLGNDLYKFGATYQRQPLDHQPSDNAKGQMTEALDKMISVPYEIVDQVCGIRPTTRDRRPILGTHRTYKSIHILNGFGSRGIMLSPKLGEDLLMYIFKKETIENEISIQRIYAQT